jgi:RNA polymerase sigma factor (sigma-70 family)
MPTSVIERIRRVVGDGLRDGELLGRYVDRRDEAALAALINRHGPMVWGVCRRQLSHHDAEDAFQATFIVLVRKASSIAQREAVGNWLYGVARQTALQARRSAARRRAREVQVTEMPDAEAPQERWADLQPSLDEELSRLPDHYRVVIVLSDLDGMTRKEVAAQLGCPEGTVASRLVRARAMLAKRLTRRGLALSGMAAALSQNVASAGVPASVLFSTIKAANLFAAGQAVISSKVAALAEGVLKTMLVSKLKASVAVVLVLGFLALGAIGVSIASGQQKGDTPQASEKAQKVEDAVVKEKAEKEDATAWGKEVDGLQAGLAADSSTSRQGEKLKLAVKLRNVGKAEVKITYGLLREHPPEVTATDGGNMSAYMPISKGYKVRVTELTIKPGEIITLYNPEVAVESEALTRLKGLIRVDTPTICVEPGKYKIAFGGMIQNHPKLATGSVEFEVKPARVTAWGEEVDGVQVGIQFDEDRAYTVGETVTLIVRLRNNGKKDVPFVYNSEYFQKNPPLVTDADGKAIKVKERNIFGFIKKGSLAPGKEADLCKLALDFRPETDRKKDESWTLYGTGKFHIQYKDVPVVGEPRLEAPATTYATGKLELEVKAAEKKR